MYPYQRNLAGLATALVTKKMGSRNKPLNSVIAMSFVQLVAAEGMSWSDSTSEMFWNVS